MTVQLDILLSQLGNPGRYQIIVFFLLCLNFFPIVFNHVIMAFLGSRPKYQCHSTAFYNSTDKSVADFADISDVYRGVKGEFETCRATYISSSGNKNVSVTCPDGDNSIFVYEKSEEFTSIVTEWDLVCGQAYMAPLATTIYFCGVMVGGVVFGHLGDKFGRKPVMLVTLYLSIAVGVGTSFAPWYWLFVTLRFIQGILIQGLQLSTYTLAMEIFLPRHRSYAGAILECSWAFSVMTVALIAYLVQDWRYLQLAISLPSVLTVVYIYLVPESVRWLLMTKRTEAAEKHVAMVTNWNNLDFPKNDLVCVNKQLEHEDIEGHRYSFLDTLRTPVLRKRSVILFYLWFAISVGYYGLTWKLTELPGNKYLIFFIAGAAEFVADTLVIFITKRFGRKKPLLTYFVMTSVFTIGAGVSIAVKSDLVYLSSGLAIAGKFSMGGLFSVIFLYTSELYPTIIRNIGMGSCTFWTRVGGVVAPQILLLDEFVNKAIPVILFGVIILLGGALTILLPETHDRKLPETIDDIENPATDTSRKSDTEEKDTTETEFTHM